MQFTCTLIVERFMTVNDKRLLNSNVFILKEFSYQPCLLAEYSWEDSYI